MNQDRIDLINILAKQLYVQAMGFIIANGPGDTDASQVARDCFTSAGEFYKFQNRNDSLTEE